MISIEKFQAVTGATAAVEARFLRPEPASRYISVSRATFYNLLNAGKLKSHRIGGARLIDREELDRFVLSHSS